MRKAIFLIAVEVTQHFQRLSRGDQEAMLDFLSSLLVIAVRT